MTDAGEGGILNPTVEMGNFLFPHIHGCSRGWRYLWGPVLQYHFDPGSPALSLLLQLQCLINLILTTFCYLIFFFLSYLLLTSNNGTMTNAVDYLIHFAWKVAEIQRQLKSEMFIIHECQISSLKYYL